MTYNELLAKHIKEPGLYRYISHMHNKSSQRSIHLDDDILGDGNDLSRIIEALPYSITNEGPCFWGSFAVYIKKFPNIIINEWVHIDKLLDRYKDGQCYDLIKSYLNILKKEHAEYSKFYTFNLSFTMHFVAWNIQYTDETGIVDFIINNNRFPNDFDDRLK